MTKYFNIHNDKECGKHKLSLELHEIVVYTVSNYIYILKYNFDIFKILQVKIGWFD